MIPVNHVPVNQTFDVNIDDIAINSFYVGKALKGSNSGDSVWQIRKITETGDNVTVSYADDSTRYNKVWDDRSSYTY